MSLGNLYFRLSLFDTSPSLFTYPLTARVVGAQQMTSQPVFFIFFFFFPVFHCPLELGELKACPFPDVFPPLLLLLLFFFFFWLPCLLPPFTVSCRMVLARPAEREIRPYHFSLRLFTVVRRSSCGPIAWWILAQTSSLVVWSLYETRSILR